MTYDNGAGYLFAYTMDGIVVLAARHQGSAPTGWTS